MNKRICFAKTGFLFFLSSVFLLFFAGTARATYSRAFGGSTVTSAAVLAPNQYYDFEKTLEEESDYVYYFYKLRTSGKACWVKWHLEQLDDYKTERGLQFSTGLPIISDSGVSGSRMKFLQSPELSAGGWSKYETGQDPTLLVTYRESGPALYRIWAEVDGDRFTETPGKIPVNEIYDRSSVISDTCPKITTVKSGVDQDWFQFQTDGTSVYKISFTVKDRFEDLKGNATLIPYKNGKRTTLGISKDTYEYYDVSYIGFSNGTGTYSQETSNTYYIQLAPNTRYQFCVEGTNCEYTISFGKVSLSELSEKKRLYYNLYIDRNYYDASIRHLYDDLNYFNARDGLIYKGAELKPAISLSYSFINDQNSSEGSFKIPKDEYSVTYENNDAPGTAYVVVHGKGNLTDVFRAPFTIKADPNSPAKGTKLKDKKSNGKYKVTIKGAAVEYTGPISKKASIVIPNTVTIDKIKYKVTSISPKALKKHSKLKKLTLGSNIKKIGAEAFSGCTALKSIIIPSEVKQIGKKAFFNCKKLKSITIKTRLLSANSVGKDAFKGTAARAAVKVPKEQQKNYKNILRKKGLNKKASVKS